jgi:2-aminoadipate transaminase
MNATLRFARRMSGIKASAVREILKVTERPDIISFAGGLPAAELFPIEALARAHAEVFQNSGGAALQYSTTEGYRPLREWLCERLRKQGFEVDVDRLLITSGSQQGIDLTAKLLLDPGDTVLVENPTYLAALQAFSAYEAKFVAVGSDAGGMDVDEVERVLERSRPKLIYVVPDFQNPKGTTLTLERRKKLLRLAQKHGVPILEDDPYGRLRYSGEDVPSLASLDDSGLVIHLGTFSKTLAPGVRIGWAVASPEVVRQLAVAKQAADLHSSTLSQRAVAKMLESFDYDGHLAKLRSVYGARLAAMSSALERHFPVEAKCTRPQGGLFVWAQLPGGIAAEELLEDSLRQGVAFVPGASFFAKEQRRDFARLNFSNRSPETIEDGIHRIGEALKRRLKLAG